MLSDYRRFLIEANSGVDRDGEENDQASRRRKMSAVNVSQERGELLASKLVTELLSDSSGCGCSQGVERDRSGEKAEGAEDARNYEKKNITRNTELEGTNSNICVHQRKKAAQGYGFMRVWNDIVLPNMQEAFGSKYVDDSVVDIVRLFHTIPHSVSLNDASADKVGDQSSRSPNAEGGCTCCALQHSLISALDQGGFSAVVTKGKDRKKTHTREEENNTRIIVGKCKVHRGERLSVQERVHIHHLGYVEVPTLFTRFTIAYQRPTLYAVFAHKHLYIQFIKVRAMLDGVLAIEERDCEKVLRGIKRVYDATTTALNRNPGEVIRACGFQNIWVNCCVCG